MSVVVVDIGCLECEYPSEIVGVYPSVEEARAANPEAMVKAEMEERDWHGSGVEVIFDLPEETDE